MPAIIDGTTGVTFPTWTTSTRPASPAIGQSGFNTTLAAAETYSGTAWYQAGRPGNILQVLQAFKTDTYSQTSQTYTVITGLTVSITPTSSTSKILVMAQIGCNGLVGADSWYFAVGRGGSVVTASTGDAAGSRPRATAVVQQTDAAIGGSNSQFTIPIMFLDSPATTSATTYSVMGRTANGGTLYINRTGADRDTANYDPRWTSSITVMEILV
jgi:hypothetical protein